MKLISPRINMEEAFMNAAKDFQAHGEKYYQEELENKNFDFVRYVEALEADGKGVNLALGRVPENTFWLIGDSGEAILGASRLRHYLVPRLQIVGGHIGYDVPPSQRRKGYGTVLLKMTLERAKELGLSRVLVTCDFDNVGSEKIILHNGGVLENEVYSEDKRKMTRRYWIEL